MYAACGRANGFCAQAFEDALEGLGVADFEFDFGFVGQCSSNSETTFCEVLRAGCVMRLPIFYRSIRYDTGGLEATYVD